RTCRRKEVGAVQCKIECSSATHGKARNSAISFLSAYPVCLFYVGHELFEKEIFITPRSVGGISISPHACVGIGHHHDHGCCLTFFNGLIGDVLHLAKLHPARLIVATTV